MTQEFHISVTPVGGDEYLVRTERVAPGVPLAEEQVSWSVTDWLAQASRLMNDPLQELLRGDSLSTLAGALGQTALPKLDRLPSDSLVTLGQQLYNALFQGTIRDSWMTAQGIAKHRHEVLRLRLGLKDRRLPRLPWEVLHNGDRPLTTGTDVVFSRYHSGLSNLISPATPQQITLLETDQPLKILMVLAAPTDQAALSLKQEVLHLQEELHRSLGNGSQSQPFPDVELTILEQPGRAQLTHALEHQHYHILHYAGHSNPGPAGGSLSLVSNQTGLTETLSGDDLAGLLVNNGIRLAVFNSCRGVYTAAVPSDDTANDGNLAEALVRRGTPAVLAMAERIPDDVALTLSRLFYRNLKQAYPIDLSLNRARQGLLSSYGSHQFYWALPILYLNPEFDGCLKPQESEFSTLDWDVSEMQTVLEPYTPEPEPVAEQPPVLEEEFWVDPEDLEFEDPLLEDDMAAVAHLVQQLSLGTVPSDKAAEPSPAVTTNGLSPEQSPGFKRPTDPVDVQRPSSYPPATATALSSAALAGTALAGLEQPANAVKPAGSVAVVQPPGTDQAVQMYSELESLLADTGKLTDAIAASNEAIQLNPYNADAYHNLGWALYQQGYLAEAIVAYQQALRINPQLAHVYNHLGLAYYHQGNVSEAIAAYHQALQLSPRLTEVHQNLAQALHRQTGVSGFVAPLVGVDSLATAYPGTSDGAPPLPASSTGSLTGSPATVPPATVPAPTQQHWLASKTAQKVLLWGGAGLLGLTALLGGLALFQQFNGASLRIPPTSLSGSAPQSTDLQHISTGVVAALAIEQLNQGDVAAAKVPIETLLDRGALQQAAAILTSVLSKQANDPTINFLMGRLAWQFVKSGNSNYSLDDARRYWELAVRQQPTPLHNTALGFAYYAEGRLMRAKQSWLTTLRQTEPQTTPDAVAGLDHSKRSPAVLTAYAGLAMMSMKLAEDQPPTRKAELLSEAIRLRQVVLTEEPVQFLPNSLAQNWLWTEAAIADWQAVLALQ